MHPWILSLIFLTSTTLPIIGQGISVSGAVRDKETMQPVEYVTVYFNGTTRGTITDSEGRFELKGISLPGDLILSHVSYNVLNFHIADTSDLYNLHFELNKKIVPLQEVTVILDSTRLDYLARFKLWFLGTHYEKTGASILNESALLFLPSEGDQFEAIATEPLVIDLPQIGYRLNTDLVHFKVNIKKEVGGYHCSILGYFFFEEIAVRSRRQQRLIARKRVETYYNSRLHFCRSLYNNALTENGYVMKRACPDQEKEVLVKNNNSDFSSWYSETGGGQSVLYLTDFLCPLYSISYYHNWSNKPTDLTYLDASPTNRSISALYFDNDTIRIYSSGRVADNSILFEGAIGDKGVAWMLPEDYIPSMQ